MPKYYAQQDGFIDGTHRGIDEEVSMEKRQAKYHLLEGRLGTEPTPKPVKGAEDAAAGKGTKAGN